MMDRWLWRAAYGLAIVVGEVEEAVVGELSLNEIVRVDDVYHGVRIRPAGFNEVVI
jgi:hypothetical protein